MQISSKTADKGGPKLPLPASWQLLHLCHVDVLQVGNQVPELVVAFLVDRRPALALDKELAAGVGLQGGMHNLVVTGAVDQLRTLPPGAFKAKEPRSAQPLVVLRRRERRWLGFGARDVDLQPVVIFLLSVVRMFVV